MNAKDLRLHQEHLNHLRHEADLARLAAETEAGAPALQQRLLATVGRVLIASGERLVALHDEQPADARPQPATVLE